MQTQSPASVDSILSDLLADDLHAEGCFSVPPSSGVPNVAALNAEAYSVRDLQERVAARGAETVRSSRLRVAA